MEKDILDDLFNERDRKLIRQVPLGSDSRLDRWYWLWDEKSVYSVKSDYRCHNGFSLDLDDYKR